jgi:hypothetical protein
VVAPAVAVAVLLVLMVPIGLPEAGNAGGIVVFVLGVAALAMNLWLLWRGLRALRDRPR